MSTNNKPQPHPQQVRSKWTPKNSEKEKEKASHNHTNGHTNAAAKVAVLPTPQAINTTIPPVIPTSSASDSSSALSTSSCSFPTSAVRLSSSAVYSLQREFFSSVPVSHWSSQLVPSFISSNAFIAKQLVDIFLSFLRDAASGYRDRGVSSSSSLSDSSSASAAPVYILDVGAGNGKLGFHFLQEFARRRQEILSAPATLSSLALTKFRSLLSSVVYVMTDAFKDSIAFLESMPQLQSFVQEKLLDFAIFDAEHPHKLHAAESSQSSSPNACMRLRNSGALIGFEECAVDTPMFIIANYLFDSLTTDAFRLKAHSSSSSSSSSSLSSPSCSEVYEARVLLHSAAGSDSLMPHPSMSDPDCLSRLRFSWSYDEIDAESYYTNDLFNQILSWYSKFFQKKYESANIKLQKEKMNVNASDSTVDETSNILLLPIGGLSCLQSMRYFTRGPQLLISGDKAMTQPPVAPIVTRITRKPSLAALSPSAFIVSHGSVSVTVNHHSLALLTRALGGYAYLTEQSTAPFKLAAYLFPSTLNHSHEEEDNSGLFSSDRDSAETAEDIQWHMCKTPALPAYFYSTLQTLKRHFDSFSPYDWWAMQNIHSVAQEQQNSLVSNAAIEAALPYALSFLRLSNYDSDVFNKIKFIFSQTSNTLSPTTFPASQQFFELRDGLVKVLANIYCVQPQAQTDVAFELGNVLLQMKEYGLAMEAFDKSHQLFGANYGVAFNHALCLYQVQRYEEAKQKLQLCLQLCPEFTDATAMLAEIAEIEANKVESALKSTADGKRSDATPHGISEKAKKWEKRKKQRDRKELLHSQANGQSAPVPIDTPPAIDARKENIYEEKTAEPESVTHLEQNVRHKSGKWKPKVKSPPHVLSNTNIATSGQTTIQQVTVQKSAVGSTAALNSQVDQAAYAPASSSTLPYSAIILATASSTAANSGTATTTAGSVSSVSAVSVSAVDDTSCSSDLDSRVPVLKIKRSKPAALVGLQAHGVTHSLHGNSLTESDSSSSQTSAPSVAVSSKLNGHANPSPHARSKTNRRAHH